MQISALLLVPLQDLVNATAALCSVLKEVEMLLLSVRLDDQPIEQQPLLELNVFNRVSRDLMIAQPEHSLRHKDQIVVADLKIPN